MCDVVDSFGGSIIWDALVFDTSSGSEVGAVCETWLWKCDALKTLETTHCDPFEVNWLSKLTKLWADRDLTSPEKIKILKFKKKYNSLKITIYFENSDLLFDYINSSYNDINVKLCYT
jgi:hypothetical protein